MAGTSTTGTTTTPPPVPAARGAAAPEVHERVSNASVAGAVAGRIGRTIVTLLLSGVVLIAAWYALLALLDVDAFVGKRPLDVYDWLFTIGSAPDNRTFIGDALTITLKDSAVGFVAGIVAAVVVASLFTMFRQLEFAFMPLAMLLRSVPLVAMAPLIGLTFGRGIAGNAAIGGVVVFFPVLVNLALGLRSASPQSMDLVRVNGGTRWTALRKVAIPTALPNVFAAVRISVPGAVIGAMLYEWLFSARGLGVEIIRANSQVQYSKLWTIVVVVTFTSILLYTLVSIVETIVLAKWGPNAGKR